MAISSLEEALATLDIQNKLYGIGNITPKSVFPDFVMLVGNWKLTEGKTILLADPCATNNSSVGFGSVKMYPPELVDIDILKDNYIWSNCSPSDSSSEIYCFEIQMTRTASRQYSGNGQLTIAYNKNFLESPEYTIDISKEMPDAIAGINVNCDTIYSSPKKVYLSSVLEDTSGSDIWKLNISLKNIANPEIVCTVYEQTFSNSISASQFESEISGFAASNASSGTVSNVFSTVGDIRIITPKDIDAAFVGSNGTNDLRTVYIYEFISDFG